MSRSRGFAERRDGGVIVSVVSQNGPAESLLGYLHESDLSAAALVADPLLASLNDESAPVDPSTAAVVGYFLLRTGDTERMEGWVERFARRFPWMGDARIIEAWQRVRRKYARKSRFARQLLHTLNAGLIPVYTEGVRLLLDGVRLMPEAFGESERVRALADAVERSQPLTTYYGADPNHPHPELHYGAPDEDTTVVWT